MRVRDLHDRRILGTLARTIMIAWLLPALHVSVAAAQVERCGHAGRPWVVLVFASSGFEQRWTQSVAADLRAGLRLRGIDVCALGSDGAEPPLALVEISSTTRDHVSVSIDVHDAITEKRVLRDVDLRRVTQDGTGLVVAQAAEELLRASWAELALQDAPAPAIEPPPEVQRAVAPEATGGTARDFEIGVLFAVAHHAGGLTLLGGDAFFGLWFGPGVGLEFAAGLREGLREPASRGDVDASALSLRADMVLALLSRRGRYDLLAKAGTEVLSVRFSGDPARGALGQRQSVLAMSARAGVAVRVPLASSLRLGFELGSGVPLMAAVATSMGEPVSATSGLLLHGSVGASWVF
jgi:hypothetical protein